MLLAVTKVSCNNIMSTSYVINSLTISIFFLNEQQFNEEILKVIIKNKIKYKIKNKLIK